MIITTEVLGLEELDRKFNELLQVSKKATMRKALNAGIKPIKDEVKNRAPVKSGVLKSAIRSKQMTKTKYPSVGIYVQGKAYYWYFIEHGTSKMSAAPFLRPAVDAKHEEGVEKFKERLSKEIDKLMIG